MVRCIYKCYRIARWSPVGAFLRHNIHLPIWQLPYLFQPPRLHMWKVSCWRSALVCTTTSTPNWVTRIQIEPSTGIEQTCRRSWRRRAEHWVSTRTLGWQMGGVIHRVRPIHRSPFTFPQGNTVHGEIKAILPVLILRCHKFREFGNDSLVWVGWLEPGTLSTGKLGFNQKTNFYRQEISLLKQQSIEDNRQGKVSLFFYNNMDTQVQKNGTYWATLLFKLCSRV